MNDFGYSGPYSTKLNISGEGGPSSYSAKAMLAVSNSESPFPQWPATSLTLYDSLMECRYDYTQVQRLLRTFLHIFLLPGKPGNYNHAVTTNTVTMFKQGFLPGGLATDYIPLKLIVS